MSDTIELCLEPGDLLYQEGDESDFAYIVVSGELLLFSEFAGERVKYEKRARGSIIGELSILLDKPRTVSVEAVTACRLFRITSDQILRSFHKLDPILRACIDTSMNFVATFTEHMTSDHETVAIAPHTLSDVDGLIAQLTFERDILDGLKNDEFFLNYQPIVSLADHRIHGFEALMRWQHPERGNVPPFHFIQVAEDMGAIGELTQLALKQACIALSHLHKISDETRGLFMCVNISGSDLETEGFIETVAHILDASDVDPTCLKLEITETALVKDPEGAAVTLHALRAMGCGISIDDFGTGYSNLAYLKALPFTTLKIDRAFAGDAYANAISRSIVSMLLRLGKDMKVDIVAEGLETIDDVETLKALGCGNAQGYYFSKPCGLTEIEAMLRPGGATARKRA